VRKRWRLAAAAVGLVLSVWLAAWLLQPRAAHIDEAACDRIEVGMTRRQVEDILGGPPGFYAAGKLASFSDSPPAPGEPAPEDWWGEGGRVSVTFDAEGHVTHKRFRNVYPFGPEPLWRRLLRRLGLCPPCGRRTRQRAEAQRGRAVPPRVRGEVGRMLGDWRYWLSILLAGAGLVWWLGVEVYRGRSQEHSARMFWLHLTAPVVAIVLLLVAVWLALGSERVKAARAGRRGPPAVSGATEGGSRP
jgi:hypothetical protein